MEPEVPEAPLVPAPVRVPEKKKKRKKGPARRFIERLSKKKIPQSALLPRLPKMAFAHVASIERGADPVGKLILEKYHWLGDAMVRALEGVKSGGDSIFDLGAGKFGRTWMVTYGEVDYAMKISFHDFDDVPFGIGEGMIGAYLAAPDMSANKQRDIAVPAYRVRDPSKANYDPFIHVADYYGMIAFRADEGKRSLDALVGAENGRWASVKAFVSASFGKLPDPENAYALVQILEYFDGGDLENWALQAMGTDPTRPDVPDWGSGWEDRHASFLHYTKLAFYEISLTVVRLRELGFAHGDLHLGNVLLRLVKREDAMAIYKRAEGLYNLLDTDPRSAPPFAGATEGEFPVFAMGDLGLSVIGSLGRAAGKKAVAHQAQDLHKLAVWVFYIVATAGAPPLDTSELGSMPDPEFWAEARAYTNAFHEMHAFLSALMKFLVLPDEAQRVFMRLGRVPTSVNNLEYGDNFFSLSEYVKCTKRYSDLWTNTFSRSREFPGSTPEFWSSRTRLLNRARADEMEEYNAKVQEAVGNGNFGKHNFHDGTSWTLADNVLERQVRAVEENVVAPDHMLMMEEEDIPPIARQFELVQPEFVAGDEEFWSSRPSPARARGKAGGDDDLLWDEDEEEEEESEEEGERKAAEPIAAGAKTGFLF